MILNHNKHDIILFQQFNIFVMAFKAKFDSLPISF